MGNNSPSERGQGMNRYEATIPGQVILPCCTNPGASKTIPSMSDVMSQYSGTIRTKRLLRKLRADSTDPNESAAMRYMMKPLVTKNMSTPKPQSIGSQARRLSGLKAPDLRNSC